jgi:DNA adenine methylase
MADPFLKWAGGKRGQLETLLPLVQERLSVSSTYFEPCVGGGALGLALNHPTRVFSDRNGCLVATYIEVRDRPWDVLQELQSLLEAYHTEDPEAVYYGVREAWHANRIDRYVPGYLKAAQLIFLNRTCYNGLYRENQDGFFNTPWEPADVIGAASEALQGVQLWAGSFEAVEVAAEAGDVVYFDPPYCVEDGKGFTAYSIGGPDPEFHSRLAATCLRMASQGVHVLVSGSDCEATRAAYQGFSSVTPVVARRSIGARTRQPASELLMIA